MYYVYEIRNKINNKYYIGVSVDVKSRVNRHFRELKNNKHHNFYMQKDYLEYKDIKIFKVSILKSIKNKNLAYKYEEYFIQNDYDNNYNISKYSRGGDNLSYHFDLKNIKLKQSKGAKRVWDNRNEEFKKDYSKKFLNENNPNYKHGKFTRKNKVKIREDKLKKVKELGLKSIHSLTNLGKIPWNKGKKYKCKKKRKKIGTGIIYGKIMFYNNLLFKSITQLKNVVGLDYVSLNSKNIKYSNIRIATKEDLLNFEYYDENNRVHRGIIERYSKFKGMSTLIVCDNVLFLSVDSASKFYKVSTTTIVNRIKSNRYNYRYATEYDRDNLVIYEEN